MNMGDKCHDGEKRTTHFFLLFLLRFLFDSLVDVFSDLLELVPSLRTKVDLA